MRYPPASNESLKATVTCSFKLRKYQKDYLDAISRECGVGMSQLYREALDVYLIAAWGEAKIFTGRFRQLVRELVHDNNFKDLIAQFRDQLTWPSFLATALIETCSQGKLKMLKLCVDNGADALINDAQALKEAVNQGNKDIVFHLLKEFAFTADQLSMALVGAARKKNYAIVNALLRQGITLHGAEDALYWASAAGDIRTVDELLKAGITPLSGAESPLIAAVRGDHKLVVDTLLQWTVFSVRVLYMALTEAVHRAGDDIVHLLLNSGAPAHMAEASDPLFAAVSRQRYEIISLLVKKGSDPGHGGLRCFRAALKLNSVKVIRFLCGEGFELEDKANLFIREAAELGALRMVDYLVKELTFKDQPLHKDSSVVEAAVKGNSYKTVIWLLSKGFEPCKLRVTARAKDVKIFKKILAVSNAGPDDVYNCFLDAMDYSNDNLVAYFLKEMPEVIETVGGDALLVAVDRGDLVLVARILKAVGMSELYVGIESFDDHPVCRAVLNSDMDMLVLLLKNSPGMVYVNYAMGMAEEADNTEAIKILTRRTSYE